MQQRKSRNHHRLNFQGHKPSEWLPRVILHRAVMLDGSPAGMGGEPPYHLASVLGAGAFLSAAGSLLREYPLTGPEMPSDRRAPTGLDRDKRPYWVIEDAGGLLMNRLHAFRKMDAIKEIIVVVTEETPEDYLDYLVARSFPFLLAGQDQPDWPQALAELRHVYGLEAILVNTGSELEEVLLDGELISEISMVLHPTLRQKSSFTALSGIPGGPAAAHLRLRHCETFSNGEVWLHYELAG